MVDFDVNKNLNDLSQEQREKIKLAVASTHNKMRPNSEDLQYLYDLFKQNIDQTFQGNCSRCKKRITGYWQLRLKNWGMI